MTLRKRHNRVAILFGLALGCSSAFAAKQALDTWYAIESDKVLVKMELDGHEMTLVEAKEMLLDRKGYSQQILQYRPDTGTHPSVMFFVIDLGYSDRSFVKRSGDTREFRDTVLRIHKDADITGEGDTKNSYGKLKYVDYTSAVGEHCMATSQYGGSDGGGDIIGAEALGSTNVIGFFCTSGSKMTEAERSAFISAYRADL